MGGVDGIGQLLLAAEHLADEFAETIAAIAHGEEIELIMGADCAPAGGEGAGGVPGGKRSLEFVWND